MRTIWKFPVDLYDSRGMVTTRPKIMMPEHAQVLTLQMQNLVPTVWALVDPDQPKVEREFVIVGTGQPVPPAADLYVGTWQSNGFVFHVFEADR